MGGGGKWGGSAIGLLVAVACLSGCGGDGEETSAGGGPASADEAAAIRAGIEDQLAAVAAEDPAALCDSFSEHGQFEFLVAHGGLDRPTCDEIAEGVPIPFDAVSGDEEVGDPIMTRGSFGFAVVRGPTVGEVRVEVEEADGEWRVADTALYLALFDAEYGGRSAGGKTAPS